MPTTHLNPPSLKPAAFSGAGHTALTNEHLSIIETRDGSNDLLQQYVHGLTYVDELVELAFTYYPPGATACDNFYAVLQDANYNVLGMVESYYGLGLVERYEYSPYGKRQVLYCSGGSDLACYVPLSQSLTCNWIGTLFNEFGHQGLLHDEETGLIYNRARFLHPTLGRFMQQDPMGYVDGINLYLDYRNNPVRYRDPRGLQATTTDKANGTWKVNARGGSVVMKNGTIVSDNVSVEFTPDASDCPKCKSIRIVQVTRTTDPDGKDHIWKGEEADKEHVKTKADKDKGIEGFYHIDYSASGGKAGEKRSKYYLDHFPNKNDPRAPHDGFNIDGQPPRSTLIVDTPGGPIAESFKAETCAQCVESGDYLSCVKWGFDSISPDIFLPDKEVISPRPSATFLEAEKIFDDFYKNGK